MDDFLNHFLSFGIDKIWRNKTIKIVGENQPNYILDVATGTGDLAFVAQKKLDPKKIIGLEGFGLKIKKQVIIKWKKF